MSETTITIAVGAIALVMLFAQVQLFKIKSLLEEIKTILSYSMCLVCNRRAPLKDGECPDCRH